MRYVFGDYSLDTQRYELSRDGELIPLRPKVFQLLAYLIMQRHRVVLKQELLDHFWPAQAVLASTTRRAAGAYSLAPSSLLHIPPHTRLVLPSPNGSTLTMKAAVYAKTLTGCFRVGPADGGWRRCITRDDFASSLKSGQEP